MKLPAIAVTIALISSSAYAENIVIDCPLIRQYSEDQVNLLLNEARSVISEQEVGKIFHRYVSLKNECQANERASRIVAVSENLRNWLAENGVDVRKLGGRM